MFNLLLSLAAIGAWFSHWKYKKSCGFSSDCVLIEKGKLLVDNEYHWERKKNQNFLAS